MSLIILSAVSYLPKAPLCLPLAVSYGFRNVLGPRFGMYEIQLDATALLDLLLSVYTFRYVRKLNLYIPSMSTIVHAETFKRIAATCPYLEELTLAVVFISARDREFKVSHFDGLKEMTKLEYFCVSAPAILTTQILKDIAPPRLRTYIVANAGMTGNISGQNMKNWWSDLPRSLTAINLSSVNARKYYASVDDASVEKLVHLPPGMKNLDLSSCGLLPSSTASSHEEEGGTFFDFSWLPQKLQVARLSRALDRNTQFRLKNWDRLPDLLITLDLSCCGIYADITDEFSFMSTPYLRTLNLRDNLFYSSKKTLRLQFPDSLTDLDIGANRFEGPIPFKDLPANLVRFNARNNYFALNIGKYDVLADLPRGLKHLDLSMMPGITTDGGSPLLFSFLPPHLEHIDLSETGISGYVDCKLFPRSMRSITLFTDNKALTSRPKTIPEDRMDWLSYFDTQASREEQIKQEEEYVCDLKKRLTENLKFSDLPKMFDTQKVNELKPFDVSF